MRERAPTNEEAVVVGSVVVLVRNWLNCVTGGEGPVAYCAGGRELYRCWVFPEGNRVLRV